MDVCVQPLIRRDREALDDLDESWEVLAKRDETTFVVRRRIGGVSTYVLTLYPDETGLIPGTSGKDEVSDDIAKIIFLCENAGTPGLPLLVSHGIADVFSGAFKYDPPWSDAANIVRALTVEQLQTITLMDFPEAIPYRPAVYSVVTLPGGTPLPEQDISIWSDVQKTSATLRYLKIIGEIQGGGVPTDRILSIRPEDVLIDMDDCSIETFSFKAFDRSVDVEVSCPQVAIVDLSVSIRKPDECIGTSCGEGEQVWKCTPENVTADVKDVGIDCDPFECLCRPAQLERGIIATFLSTKMSLKFIDFAMRWAPRSASVLTMAETIISPLGASWYVVAATLLQSTSISPDLRPCNNPAECLIANRDVFLKLLGREELEIIPVSPESLAERAERRQIAKRRARRRFVRAVPVKAVRTVAEISQTNVRVNALTMLSKFDATFGEWDLFIQKVNEVHGTNGRPVHVSLSDIEVHAGLLFGSPFAIIMRGLTVALTERAEVIFSYPDANPKIELNFGRGIIILPSTGEVLRNIALGALGGFGAILGSVAGQSGRTAVLTDNQVSQMENSLLSISIKRITATYKAGRYMVEIHMDHVSLPIAKLLTTAYGKAFGEDVLHLEPFGGGEGSVAEMLPSIALASSVVFNYFTVDLGEVETINVRTQEKNNETIWLVFKRPGFNPVIHFTTEMWKAEFLSDKIAKFAKTNTVGELIGKLAVGKAAPLDVATAVVAKATSKFAGKVNPLKIPPKVAERAVRRAIRGKKKKK